ncbi:vesicle transport v-SNARE 12, partial [Olea europaea subsp. europaea]
LTRSYLSLQTDFIPGFCELSVNLSRKCNSAVSLPDGEKKKQKISEIQATLDDAGVL